MRDRYVGDIGDFAKYGLLRAIGKGKRLGVAWYLCIENEGPRVDSNEVSTGDGLVEGVADATGNISDRKEDRRLAAARFNRGEVRFLVSTEAAGEGIDLQEHCSVLIHVDLPWNPMRLHQRVGRLSRYGQPSPWT